tara:strand:+ start:2931 stop:4481 length:1551 start_codon:yes stop_codon:yes gene_type:complete
MRFKGIFEGNNSAYGRLILSGKKDSRGKEKGKPWIKRETPTEQVWIDHIEGKQDSDGKLLPALGIIPINEDNKCKWGCIDVDVYNLDHKKVIDKIKELKFPLITFRSKSGGAHLFLFADKFIPAFLMQDKLRQMSEALGYEGSEVFPKQTELLTERGDVGNFLNLPYHDGTKGLRYALDEDGKALSLESFYSMYDKFVQTEEQIDSIQIKAPPKKKEYFEEGPPCLNRLADEGFGEGARNNGLFNVGVYRKKSNPDNWEDMLVADNLNVMDPPLGNTEVQALIKSLNRKGYDKYRCKDQPICGVCNASKCATKMYGVGYDEEQMPTLASLMKVTSVPPQWFLNVDDKRVELKSKELRDINLFAEAVLDQVSIVIPEVTAKNWRQLYLKNLVEGVDEIEPLKSLDPKYFIVNLLKDFTVNRPQAKKKEDILRKMAWTDEDNFCYFRMDDFYAWAKRNNWELDRTKTAGLIKDLKVFEKEVRMTLKGQTPHLIKIKSLKEKSDEKPEITQEPFEESPF